MIVVRPSILRLVLQSTNTSGGFVHRMYFATAPLLLGQYPMRVALQDRREPEIEVAGGVIDPSNSSDISGVREAAERHTPGLPGHLRVIFCRFRGSAGGGAERFYGSTEGGPGSGSPYPAYILINVERFRSDGSTLIHEMIHAAGLFDHDPDPASIFADGGVRTGVNFKPEHAKRVAESFFGR